MSLKQLWIAQCDLCGKIENARINTGQYNEVERTLPVGWGYVHNKNMHLCPECAKRR
ncbi:MAG: hypothetical protein IKN43_06895 [Selenomonadaceae bacterium]|nr:hypothetical protein [Selenomonadaceae bacterium]